MGPQIKHSTAALAIIPFAGSDICVAVHTAIGDLGYRARVLPPDRLAKPPTSAQPSGLILLLGNRGDWTEAEEYLRWVRDLATSLPTIATLVQGDATWDRELIECCADCMHWPCSREELAFRLGRTCGPARRADFGAPDPVLGEVLAGLNLVGRSPAFLDAMERIRRMARCDAPLLIAGETGTGKELAARAVHYLGPRAGGPFVPVNCGAIPDHLLENELFGHERGAFTDARSSAPGAVGEAAGGTLFLDELESLSTKAQCALLRFLQDREYRPLGGGQTRRSDARVVAASNADLRVLCERGTLRADLFFRLETLSVTLPPLRMRGGDVPILAAYFARRFCQHYGLAHRVIDPGCLDALEDYPWPGNVRELESLVHREVLLAPTGRLVLRREGAGRAAGSAARPEDPLGGASFAEAKAQAIDAFERAYLTRLMRETGGNVTRAARRANKERRALGRLLKKHRIGVMTPEH